LGKNYVRIAIKPDTYVMLREIMNALVLEHGGLKRLTGGRMTIDCVIRDALRIYKKYLKEPENFARILGDEICD